MDLFGHIDCAEKCEIPEGVPLVRVTPTRHAWSDVLRCPVCGDCFLRLPPTPSDQTPKDPDQ